MMKEKITNVFINNSDCPNGTHRTLNKYQQNKVVDELLVLVEQEKREQVREILQDLKDMMIIPDFTLHLILNTLSQKYGVRI